MPHPIYDARLEDLAISVFDVETTGLYAFRDQIIQIAVVPIDDGAISDEGWMRYVNPGNDYLPLKDLITNLTGITDADLEDAPTMSQVLEEFDEIVGTRIVSGHNVKSFDLKFMRKAEQVHGVDVQLDYYIDTLVLMRKLHPELTSHKLSACGEFYAIDFDEDELHDALADTRLTAQVLLSQIEELNTKNVSTFGEMLTFLS